VPDRQAGRLGGGQAKRKEEKWQAITRAAPTLAIAAATLLNPYVPLVVDGGGRGGRRNLRRQRRRHG
jgi:hypothetical protein